MDINSSTAGWHSIQTCLTSALISVHLIVFVGSVQPKILSTKPVVPVSTSDREVCARVLSLERHGTWCAAVLLLYVCTRLGGLESRGPFKRSYMTPAKFPQSRKRLRARPTQTKKLDLLFRHYRMC